MPRKIRQLFLNISILFVTICLVFLASEILIRAFSSEPVEDNWVGPSKQYYEYDPLLGWRKIPNTKTTRVSEKGKISVSFQINSKGIRGPEYSYEKTENEYRILALGDSFSEGYMVEFEDLFSEVMTRNLGNINTNKHFLAINSGTSAWSTDQELLFFQNEGKKYKPDLTVLVFFQNDLAYNNQFKNWSMYYKPLFQIKNGELVLTNVPVPRPDINVNSDQLTRKDGSMFKRLRELLHGKSYLYGFIKERVKNTYFLNNLAIKLRLLEESKNENNLLYSSIYKFWEKTENESIYETWQITEALLVKLKEETDSIGSNLLVFFIPFEANFDQEIWRMIKKKYGFSDEKWDINKVAFQLGKICERNNIDFINPTELFEAKARELKKNNKSLNNTIDRHWNVEGHKFVGEILADYIDSKYMKNNR